MVKRSRGQMITVLFACIYMLLVCARKTNTRKKVWVQPNTVDPPPAIKRPPAVTGYAGATEPNFPTDCAS